MNASARTRAEMEAEAGNSVHFSLDLTRLANLICAGVTLADLPPDVPRFASLSDSVSHWQIQRPSQYHLEYSTIRCRLFHD